MAKAKPIKRTGQSKPHKIKGKTGLYYKKAGKTHKVSKTRDAKIKSKGKRKRGSPTWRGDLKGSKI